MILVVLLEGGCWRTLSALWKYGGDKSDTARGEGGETGEETVEDRKCFINASPIKLSMVFPMTDMRWT